MYIYNMYIYMYIKHARPFVSFNNLLLDFIHSCRFTESSHTTEYIYIYIYMVVEPSCCV